MKKLLTLAFLALATFAFGQKIPKSAFMAKYVSSYDGDAVRIQVGNAKMSLRLAGTNAPERRHDPIVTEEQDGADQARQFLLDLIPEGALILVDTLKVRDRFNRPTARVWTNTGPDEEPVWEDVSYLSLRWGWSWYVYNPKLPPSARKAYSNAEKMAKMEKGGIGIWDREEFPSKPVNPSIWRKKHGSGIVYRIAHPFDAPDEGDDFYEE